MAVRVQTRPVDAGAEHGDEALAHGVLVGGGAVHDGCRADSGVVDEGRAAGADDGYARKCADSGPEIEGLAEYARHGRRNGVEVRQDDVEYHQEVHPHHEGHEDGGHVGDSLYASENDEADNHGYGAAEEEAVCLIVLEAEECSDFREEGAGGDVVGVGEGGHEGLGELVGVHDAHRAE